MVTSTQIAALKYLIEASRHGTPLGKKLLWFLLDQSEGLTKEVCVTLTEHKGGFSGEEIHQTAILLDGMNGRSGTTHLAQIFKATGSDFTFSLHFGNFAADGAYDTSGMFPGCPVEKVLDPKLVVLGAACRYTFWLARTHFADSAQRVSVTRADLEKINLSRSGLYPEIEDQKTG